MNLRLILCAFGWHHWYYQCASRLAARNSARRCGHCDKYEEGRWIGNVWGQHGFFFKNRIKT